MKLSQSLVLSCCILLTACSTIKTTRNDGCGSDVSSCTGLTYFLPLKRVLLTATRTPLDLQMLTKELQAANTERSNLVATITSLQGGIKEKEAILEQFSQDASIKNSIVVSKVSLQLAVKKEQNLAVNMEKMRQEIAAAMSGKNCADKISLRLLPAEPDQSYRYTAKIRHWIVRSEDLSISTNVRGLLNTGTETASLPAPSAIVAMTRAITSSECQAFKHEQVFNPTVTAAPQLPKPFDPFVLGIDAVEEKGSEASRGDRELLAGTDHFNGLLYRRSLPYLFTLAHCVKQPCEAEQAAVVMLPNDGPVGIVPFNASAFVKTYHDVEFQDGVLTRWGTDRPAELTEIIKIPIELLNALLSAPATFISSFRATP